MTSGTMAAQTRVHHLWIVQQDTAASDSLAIAADQSSVTTNNTGQTYSFKYYNLTIDGWSAPTGSRNTALNWIGNAAATAEVYDSVFRSNADQYAPQGVQQSGVASNLYIHNNYFDMATNTTGETARGIAFNSNLIPASTDIARADDNYFIPRNNRAIRIRSRRAQVLRSFIESPAQTATATQGSVHFADQIQAYSEDYSGAIVKDTIVNNQGSGNNVFYIIAGLNARVEGTVKRGSAAGKLANMVVSGANYSITNISTDGTTVSVVTGANGFGDGSYPDSANRHGVIVTISGTTNYNGTYTLASITDSTHFAFLKTGSFATETSGTASADGSTSWYMYNNDAFASPNFNITINGTNNGTTTYCNSGTGSNGGAGSGTAANTNTCP
jgi:hypothetical protein